MQSHIGDCCTVSNPRTTPIHALRLQALAEHYCISTLHETQDVPEFPAERTALHGQLSLEPSTQMFSVEHTVWAAISRLCLQAKSTTMAHYKLQHSTHNDVLRVRRLRNTYLLFCPVRSPGSQACHWHPACRMPPQCLLAGSDCRADCSRWYACCDARAA
jgi:hypothetical protein